MAGPERLNMAGEGQPGSATPGPEAGGPQPELSVSQLLQIIATQQGQIAQLAASVGRLTTVMERAQGTDQMPERAPGQPSTFQRTIDQIEKLNKQQPSPDRDAALARAIEQRDRLYQEAKDFELFKPAIVELSGLLYDARVKVTNNEKEGKEEFQGRGKIQKLTAIKDAAHSDWVIRDPQVLQGTRVFQGEARSRFWSSPAVRVKFDPIEQRWAQHGHTEWKLENRYGGMVDYFYQQSIDTILEIIEDRKKYTSEGEEYPNQKIMDLWTGPIRDSAGHILKDEEGSEMNNVTNFNDFRSAIEEARRHEPWVPNRADYETYIRFVADDVEELEEMIPFIVDRVRRKLGTGQPDKLSQRLEQEKEKLDNALAAFPEQLIPSEREFRRLKSILDGNLNLMGAYYFSEKIRDDWGPYLGYLGLLADATQDTEQQDHLVDALILDKDGLTMLSAHKFLEDDGIFWRYDKKSADIPTKTHDVSKLFLWQKNRRQDIVKFLMKRRLKSMQNLLNMDDDGKPQGGPNHPAFQRLKKKFEALDKADSTTERRWDEYCKKASEWGKTGKYGDPRDPERVIFQHPLARTFKPPTKNATSGQIESEFLDMFEEDKRTDSNNKEYDERYASEKRRKIRSTMGKAERLCRALMLDSASALAWHRVKPIDTKATGKKLVEERVRVTKELAEINEYLTGAGMDPITIEEAVPQKTLYRALMQACIREDKKKPPKDRAFKMYDLLTERLGLDLDLPLFAGWYLGWHDTGRPAVILQAIENDDRPGGLNTPGVMPAPGMDEKNTGTSWTEKERRIGILMHLVMKAIFGPSGRYFNFPGHDTQGAGVKDVRNYLNLMFGTSRDTVWLNDLLDKVGFPIKQEFTRDFGLTRDPITQLVGLYKWGDEVIFAQRGYEGAIEGPRDMKSWVKGTDENVTQSKTLTTGNKEGFALMKDGPLSGGYLWRDFDLANIKEKFRGTHEPMFAAVKPEEAFKEMTQDTFRAGVDLAAKVIGPTIKAMEHIVDSTSGPNPGTARFVRTLMWYGISKWMDTSWEFRFKPGYATDANLHLARRFMHTYLLEYGDNGLIYTDKEWDETMLGSIVKENGGKITRYQVDEHGLIRDYEEKDGHVVFSYNWVSAKVENNVKLEQGGLIDVFPKELRDEILQINGAKKRFIPNFRGTGEYDGKTGEELNLRDYILPFGLNSEFPETMANFYKDKKSVQLDYGPGLRKQIRPRIEVTRP